MQLWAQTLIHIYLLLCEFLRFGIHLVLFHFIPCDCFLSCYPRKLCGEPVEVRQISGGTGHAVQRVPCECTSNSVKHGTNKSRETFGQNKTLNIQNWKCFSHMHQPEVVSNRQGIKLLQWASIMGFPIHVVASCSKETTYKAGFHMQTRLHFSPYCFQTVVAILSHVKAPFLQLRELCVWHIRSFFPNTIWCFHNSISGNLRKEISLLAKCLCQAVSHKRRHHISINIAAGQYTTSNALY